MRGKGRETTGIRHFYLTSSSLPAVCHLSTSSPLPVSSLPFIYLFTSPLASLFLLSYPHSLSSYFFISSFVHLGYPLPLASTFSFALHVSPLLTISFPLRISSLPSRSFITVTVYRPHLHHILFFVAQYPLPPLSLSSSM